MDRTAVSFSLFVYIPRRIALGVTEKTDGHATRPGHGTGRVGRVPGRLVQSCFMNRTRPVFSQGPRVGSDADRTPGRWDAALYYYVGTPFSPVQRNAYLWTKLYSILIRNRIPLDLLAGFRVPRRGCCVSAFLIHDELIWLDVRTLYTAGLPSQDHTPHLSGTCRCRERGAVTSHFSKIQRTGPSRSAPPQAARSSTFQLRARISLSERFVPWK